MRKFRENIRNNTKAKIFGKIHNKRLTALTPMVFAKTIEKTTFEEICKQIRKE